MFDENAVWLESVLGLCVGCELHAFLVRRGWATKDADFELCGGGACEIPSPARSERDEAGVVQV